jgi:hypothetical protein
MFVHKIGGFMTVSENYQFHERKYLNKLLKDCKRGYKQGSFNHHFQFGDIAAYIITHPITILTKQTYFHWDFLIFLCHHCNDSL